MDPWGHNLRRSDFLHKRKDRRYSLWACRNNNQSQAQVVLVLMAYSHHISFFQNLGATCRSLQLHNLQTLRYWLE